MTSELEVLETIAPAEPSGRSLAELEAIIDRGRLAFLEVGRALLEIRDGRLYRETHATFEDYCHERWGFSRRYADMQIQAAAVVDDLGTMVPTPATERQARELAAIAEPEERDRVWAQAVDTYGLQPTAKQIAEVRDDLLDQAYVLRVHQRSATRLCNQVVDWITTVLATTDLRDQLRGYYFPDLYPDNEPVTQARLLEAAEYLQRLAQEWQP